VSVLEFNGVSKVFTRGQRPRTVLDEVSFEVNRGDCIALHGLNRSGKSTLLRLAVGADRPTSGSVLYEGEDYAKLGERHADLLRTEIAWIPATIDLRRELTILEQVALACYLDSRRIATANEMALAALAMAGIERCAEARISELSDGELRLAAIAQAIVKRPRLLVADDPADNLDRNERDRVLELLRRCANELGTAVLFSAPHADQTLRSSWLMHLSGGKLIVPSPPEPAEVIPLRPRKTGQGYARA
jgi:ABC-type lipoprotein export system ATPase subunit